MGLRILKIIGGVVLALMLGYGFLVVCYFHHGEDNAYGQKAVGELVVEYMKSNDGEWPQCWDDLRPLIELGKGHMGG